MSRRQPNNALEMLIFVILLIPIGAYYLMKWIVRGILTICVWVSSRKSNNSRVSIDMSAIDRMDGIAFENIFAELLRNNGYKKVEITKASGDYGVDIIAVKDSKNYAFQCKCYSSNLGIKPIQEVYSGAKMYRADIAVVVTNSYFTSSAISLANKLDVLLWNRDDFIRLARESPRKENVQDVPTPKSPFLNIDIENKRTPSEPYEWKRMANEMATILKTGRYVFGKNIPNGMYDLIAVSGGGWFTIFDKDDGEDLIWFGEKDDGTGAKEYRGLDSDVVRQFTLEGNVEVKIAKARMVVLEDEE